MGHLAKSVRAQLLLAAVLTVSLLAGGKAEAQDSVGELSLSQDQRARQYQALARDAELLDRQLGVIKRVVRLVKPTVVHIEATKRPALQLSYGRRGTEEAGSGVIVKIADEHYILTNRHVIKNSEPSRIRIKLADGREMRPAELWADPSTDVGVIRVDSKNLTAARIGDSDQLEIGDFVLAVGSPFGLSHSVTMGIISAKGRRDLNLGDERVRYQDFMQTDAAINPGNSGGPLINLRGELVGINTAIASASGGNEGIGFTIPVNMVMVVAKQLIERGTVSRAFLGVRLDARFGAAVAARLGLPRASGARITSIEQQSPAQKANLREDDVILEFNGTRVEDDSHLINLVGLTEVGKSVPVMVFRDGDVVKLSVRVGDYEDFRQSE